MKQTDRQTARQLMQMAGAPIVKDIYSYSYGDWLGPVEILSLIHI